MELPMRGFLLMSQLPLQRAATQYTEKPSPDGQMYLPAVPRGPWSWSRKQRSSSPLACGTMMKLWLLAGDCPDAAGRAKVREEGRRVERAGALAGSDRRLIGGCHLCLWHLYIQQKRKAKAGKVGSDWRCEQSSPTDGCPYSQ